MLERLPWYPTLFAATFILKFWIVTGVSLFAMTRALGVGIATVTVAFVILAMLTRRRHASALAVAFLFAVAMGPDLSGLIGATMFALALGLALRLWARAQRRPMRWTQVTAALNVFSLVLLGVVLVDGIQRGTLAALLDTDLRQGASSIEPLSGTDDDAHPDILLLLLDGYPRADVLRDDFGFDNGPFLDELEDRGFEVAAASESNYPYTQATLISMLHMRPLHEIDRLQGLWEGEGYSYPLMRQVANANPVFDALRQRGYRIVTSSPGFEHVSLRQADVFLDDDSLNEAERQLIRSTPIERTIELIRPGMIMDQFRRRTLSGFEMLESVARLEAGSTFALIHVPSPHLPIVLDRDGSLLPAFPGEEMFRTEPIEPAARDAFLRQLTYLNGRTLAAIDRVLEDSSGPDPVVVVFSDHGAEPPARDGASWEPAHYRNFLAVHPGAAGDLGLDADATLVNLFPHVFDALFAERHATWPDEHYPWIDVAVGAGAGAGAP